MPVPVSVECDVREEPQEKRKDSEESREQMKVDHPDERKAEILGSPYVIDDNITPERRPRAFAFSRSRTPQK